MRTVLSTAAVLAVLWPRGWGAGRHEYAAAGEAPSQRAPFVRSHHGGYGDQALTVSLPTGRTDVDGLRQDQPQYVRSWQAVERGRWRHHRTFWAAVASAGEGPSEQRDPWEPLVTDRPDFTESPSTVGLGTLQVEGGYTFARHRNAAGRTDRHSFGELLFRFGVVADWLELRAVVSPAAAVSSASGIRSAHAGVEDLQLGLKLAVRDQDTWIPRVGLIGQLDLPTGDGPFGAGRVLGSGLVIYGWDVNESFSLAGQTGIGGDIDGVTGRSYRLTAQSVSASLSLSPRVATYFEWFALIPSGADTERPQHYVNGGLTVLFGPDVQWDVRIGHGLTAAADDLFVGTGVSVRFPRRMGPE